MGAISDVRGGARELLSGPGLDATVTWLSVLMVFGVVTDFHAHSQGISFAEEGFFTPEHVFFYSMFLLIAAAIGAATLRNRRDGADWIDAVPPGYGWGILGILVFGAGGIGDFGWHSAFGFEESLQALTSPSHLALAAGAVLFLSSPLRASIRRDRQEGRTGGVAMYPAVFSATLALTILALFSAYVNPFARPMPYIPTAEPWIAYNLGLAGWVFYPPLLIGTALLLVRHFELGPGSLTTLFTVPALASSVLGNRPGLVWSAVLAGLVAEALVAWSPPRPSNARALRVFGAIVPGVMAASYFAIAILEGALTWSIHVWTGTIVIAAASGLLVTYVAVPDGSVGRGDPAATDDSDRSAVDDTGIASPDGPTDGDDLAADGGPRPNGGGRER